MPVVGIDADSYQLAKDYAAAKKMTMTNLVSTAVKFLVTGQHGDIIDVESTEGQRALTEGE